MAKTPSSTASASGVARHTGVVTATAAKPSAPATAAADQHRALEAQAVIEGEREICRAQGRRRGVAPMEKERQEQHVGRKSDAAPRARQRPNRHVQQEEPRRQPGRHVDGDERLQPVGVEPHQRQRADISERRGAREDAQDRLLRLGRLGGEALHDRAEPAPAHEDHREARPQQARRQR